MFAQMTNNITYVYIIIIFNYTHLNHSNISLQQVTYVVIPLTIPKGNRFLLNSVYPNPSLYKLIDLLTYRRLYFRYNWINCYIPNNINTSKRTIPAQHSIEYQRIPLYVVLWEYSHFFIRVMELPWHFAEYYV